MKYRIFDKINNCYVNNDYVVSGDGNIYNLTEKKFVSNDNYIIEMFSETYDKDGKEIWDGDIIRSSKDKGMLLYDDISPVEFYKGSFNIVALYDLTPIELSYYDTVWQNNRLKGNPQTSLWLADLEVIGNIHENKELLKHDNW